MVYLISCIYDIYTYDIHTYDIHLSGTIGYLSCFWFNLHIYGSIKVD
jgi:hypothetical protein